MRPSLLGLLSLGCFGCHGSNQIPVLRHPDHRHVSPELFRELEELSRVVDISYCVGSTSWGISKPFSCLSRCSDFPDFELVTTWNTGVLLRDSCGYIALDHGKKRIIVAFRGTYSIANTVVDLSTVPQKYVPYPGEDEGEDPATQAPKEPKCMNCTVHMGFHSSWLNSRKHILPELQAQLFVHPDYQLTLVGHSLGGAVAALAGLDLLARGYSPIVTTFGEPRAGNEGLVKYIDARFDLRNGSPVDDTKSKYRRVTHADDPVPLLPLTEWGYAMHAGEIYISKSELSPDIADLHHCNGDTDRNCIAGQDTTLVASVEDEIHEATTEPWGIPSRYKLWQLFFAHRDYFWRLGLCVPGGDPLGGGGKYGAAHNDL
ncbi:hypothetical protein CBER1_08375 [Cercospora berteroae]|uniref:Fungal lipase-type domain-containing protein n=1 Tax=Cercospora berteroae TaxID=357750 RepID=A0A2S6CGE6_9PEZI|nr:hypothetical protein CBER1_08375 [Cercospora berteroae]